MAVTPRLDLKQSQSLLMTQQLRQAISLLQVSNLELESIINQELEKNPLLEYKLEGFDIFDKLIFRIKDDMAQSIVKIRISTENAQTSAKKPISDFRASHSDLSQFGGRQPVSSAQPGNRSVTVVRSGAKVGRNDPCPCGSGKKYKNCCGNK